MQVRECSVCDGLFKVGELWLVVKDANDSSVLHFICETCLSFRYAYHEKKFPVLVDTVN